MKKSRKTALIAGGIAIAAITVGLFLFSGYNKDRLPTLPTPPGVVVPRGLRYVGGDEFDAPDNSTPDAGRWTSLNPANKLRDVSIQSGRLVIVAGFSGSAAYAIKPSAEVHTRVEFRLRMPTTEAAKQSALSVDKGLAPQHVAYLNFYREKTSTMAWGLTCQGGNATTLFEKIGETPQTSAPDYDGNFHNYAIEWAGDKISCTRDGLTSDVSLALKPYMTRIWLNGKWWRRLAFLPDVAREYIMSIRTWDFAGPQMIGIGCSDPAWASKSPVSKLRVEIDYIRIFQE